MRRFLLLSLLVLSPIFVGCNGDINNGGSGNNGGGTTTPETPETDAKPNKNNEAAYLDLAALDSDIFNAEYDAFINSSYFLNRCFPYLLELVPSEYVASISHGLTMEFVDSAVGRTIALKDNIGSVTVETTTKAKFIINTDQPKSVVIEDLDNGYIDTVTFNGYLTYSFDHYPSEYNMKDLSFSISRIKEGEDLGELLHTEGITGTANLNQYDFNFSCSGIYINESKYKNYDLILHIFNNIINYRYYDDTFNNNEFNLSLNGNSYSGSYTEEETALKLNGNFIMVEDSITYTYPLNMKIELLKDIESNITGIKVLSANLAGIEPTAKTLENFNIPF